jgi:prepilin-type processing-associated H-X9-DG protein
MAFTLFLSSQRKRIEQIIQALLLLVVVVFITLFLLFLIAKRNTNVCVENLRRIGQAIAMYREEHDGGYPLESTWRNALFPQTLQGCPSAAPVADYPGLDKKVGKITGYGYNFALTQRLRQADIPYPHTTICVCDSAQGFPILILLNPYTYTHNVPRKIEMGWKRHSGGGNYLFCDGHVTWLTEEKIHQAKDEWDGNDGEQPSFLTRKVAPHSH